MLFDNMEKDYFRFVNMGLKANYEILKKLIDKYSIEDVNQTIKDLQQLHVNAKGSKSTFDLDPDVMVAIMLIPRFTPLMELYNNQRAERRNSGNVQKEKRYFAITITTAHKYTADEVDLYIHGFVTSKTFDQYCYCIEHIHKNIHAHICLKLDSHVKCLKPKKLLEKFKKYNQKSNHEFDLTLKDNMGNPHYWAKTYKQSENFIKYICKAEADKRIYMTGILLRKYNLDWKDEIINNYSVEDFKLLSNYMEKECPADIEDDED